MTDLGNSRVKYLNVAHIINLVKRLIFSLLKHLTWCPLKIIIRKKEQKCLFDDNSSLRKNYNASILLISNFFAFAMYLYTKTYEIFLKKFCLVNTNPIFLL